VPRTQLPGLQDAREHPRAASAEAQLLTEAITQLRRALRASIRTDIPWETLPMAQVELLQTLADVSPVRIGDLAERLHLANSTISGLVAQMMSAGLVQRDNDPADRRAAIVTLTSEGRARLAEWEQLHEQRIGQAYDQLPVPDRRAISRALPALGRLNRLLKTPDEHHF
jgi:DNA-binding MarR family transcriptional regulator